MRLWDVQSGQSLWKWTVNEPCRACTFSVGIYILFSTLILTFDVKGDRMAAFTTDRFMENEPQLRLVDVEDEIDDLSESSHVLATFRPRINRLKWSEKNSVLIAAHEDGFIRKWNSEVFKNCLIL